MKGKLWHECPDWDFLPIDENSPEISCCTCESFTGKDQAVYLRNAQEFWDYISDVRNTQVSG